MIRSSRLWVLALPAAWLVLLLCAPLVIILLISFAAPADGVPPYSLGLSLENLRLVGTDPLYRDALLRSIRVAGVSTMICLLIGFPMALGIARAAVRWQNLLLLAVMLPFWTGFLMRINAWIGLLADDGLLVRLFGLPRLLYTAIAMYIGIVYTYLPFMVLPLYARLSRLDPALIEAAADLGAPHPAAGAARCRRRRRAGVHPGDRIIRHPRAARRASGRADRHCAVGRILRQPRLADRFGGCCLAAAGSGCDPGCRTGTGAPTRPSRGATIVIAAGLDKIGGNEGIENVSQCRKGAAGAGAGSKCSRQAGRL